MQKSSIPEFKPVGCFFDRGRRPRPLPQLIANFRGDIDWRNLNNTITKCARKVSEKGLGYFGLQFYGECWSGVNAHRTYNKQGTSTRCIYGVGRRRANFVYVFVKKGTFCFILLKKALNTLHMKHKTLKLTEHKRKTRTSDVIRLCQTSLTLHNMWVLLHELNTTGALTKGKRLSSTSRSDRQTTYSRNMQNSRTGPSLLTSFASGRIKAEQSDNGSDLRQPTNIAPRFF